MAINLAQFSTTGTGFGQTAYNSALAAGYTPAQIRAALPSSGLTIGQAVAQSIGGDTNLYPYRGEGGQFGLTSYNNAVAAGMTPGQIRSSLAASGLRIGDLAAQALNVNPGMTFLGYAPKITQSSYGGNSGINYRLRPQLAPRGSGMTGSGFSADLGYSPTLYIAGGTNDYEGINTAFGTNFGFNEVGGGYYDPNFNRVNYVPPASDPNRPYGGYGAQTMQIMPNAALTNYTMPAYSAPAFNYSVPGGSTVSGVKSAASSRSATSGSSGVGGAGGLQIKSVNI